MSSNIAGRSAACLTAVLGLAACGGGGSAGSGARPVPQSDLQIAGMLYTDSARTPAGFAKESPRPDLASAVTFHLKNSNLDSSATTDFELCSDDFAQALTWSETAAGTGAAYTDLVETSETADFFEFVRAPRTASGGLIRARIFKCAYVDRSQNDLRLASGAAGVLNARPIEATTLRGLAEYLWQFTTYNNFGHAVLTSSGSDAGGAWRHSLVIANLQADPSGACDRIDVIEWRHDEDKAGGQLQRIELPLWSFGARRGYAGAELCD
jgi:hypothetical protein